MKINDYIYRIGPLPISSEELLMTVFREKRFPKGHRILQENSRTYKAYVIKEGIAHAYTMKNGKSATFWIGNEGDVIYPGQSLHFNSGEYGTVELLEDSVLYEIDLVKLNELYLKDINIANWGRLAAEKAQKSDSITIMLANSGGEKVLMTYNSSTKELSFDRRQSGITDFSHDFPAVTYAPTHSKDGKLSMRIFIDRSSVEVFEKDGKFAMTNLVFPNAPYSTLSISADGGQAKMVNLKIYSIKI